MILSAVDFRFNPDEDKIIREYLVREFPIDVNLDREMETISALGPEEWEPHFLKMMDDFYDDATEAERNRFLQFAMALVKADTVITPEEHHFLRLLFDHWDADSGED